MTCISTVTYSIRINGRPHGHIVPSRGIRQGDPLSPYLFMLCAEGLSALIKKGVDDGRLEGIAVCRGGPNYLIYFSQMTASFSVGHPWKNVTHYKVSFRFMSVLLVNN